MCGSGLVSHPRASNVSGRRRTAQASPVFGRRGNGRGIAGVWSTGERPGKCQWWSSGERPVISPVRGRQGERPRYHQCPVVGGTTAVSASCSRRGNVRDGQERDRRTRPPAGSGGQYRVKGTTNDVDSWGVSGVGCIYVCKGFSFLLVPFVYYLLGGSLFSINY